LGNLQFPLNDDELKDKFEGGDNMLLQKAVQDTSSWLSSPTASPAEFQSSFEKLMGIADPLLVKAAQCDADNQTQAESGKEI